MASKMMTSVLLALTAASSAISIPTITTTSLRAVETDPMCINGTSTDYNCIMSDYKHHTCAAEDMNCKLSAYKMEHPQTADAGTTVDASAAAATQTLERYPTPTTLATTTHVLPTINSVYLSSSYLQTVDRPTGTPSPESAPSGTDSSAPAATTCAYDDQKCLAQHPPAGVVPDPYANSPIDKDGKIGGLYTPFVKRKHKEDNDDNSARCYEALVNGANIHHKGFNVDNCVEVLNSDVSWNDPHGGRYWYDGPATNYAKAHNRFPPVIDLLVDTGCGFPSIGWQERCHQKNMPFEPYMEVKSSSHSQEHWSNSTQQVGVPQRPDTQE